MNEMFRKIAHHASHIVGSPVAFALAILAIITWASAGFFFNFSNTWQLVVNTGTTILTFLMVFLLQNTQNRDAKAMQLKLDELIRAMKAARDEMIDLEDMQDEELERLQAEFMKVRERRLAHKHDRH